MWSPTSASVWTALSKTFRDIEIICVNDGSNDGSLAILKEYQEKDERITVITQENRGLSVARNSGMAAARGEYIYFIDSDDYIALETLEITTKIADEMKLDLLAFGVKQFSESGKLSWVHPDAQLPDSLQNSVLTGVRYMKELRDNNTFSSSVCKTLWRSSFLHNNDFQFKEGILFEDILFSFQALMAAERVAQIPDKFYYYRSRPDSITGKPVSCEKTNGYFQCAKGVLSYALQGSHTPEVDHEI